MNSTASSRPFRGAAVVLALLAMLSAASAARAQFHEPDAKAVEALEAVVKAYRERPALTVRAKVAVAVEQDGVTAEDEPVEAEFLLGPSRTGVVKLNGFVCYLGDGKVHAIHEETDHSYFRTPDDGSPYYTLFAMFMDLPFPHLAIGFGEDSVDDLCMQLHTKAPWIKPTGVSTITGDDAAERRRITLTSDYSTLHLDVDPASMLIDAAELTITGGDFVQAGATMTYRYEYDYETRDEPFPADVIAFTPGARQRVDMLAVLAPKPAAPEPGEGPAGRAGAGTLAGQPAPPLILSTAGGDAIDLDDLRGKVVVLDFWATWCGPCHQALPLLHNVSRWADDEQLPVEIITVNCFERGGPDERLQAVRDFWRQGGHTLPVAMDFTDETAAAYGVSGIPATFIIRSDGVIHTQHTGMSQTYETTLKRDIQAALEAVESAPDANAP